MSAFLAALSRNRLRGKGAMYCILRQIIKKDSRI